MKKILLITLASFLLTSLDLSAELVTIHVDDSDGNGISGVQIRYNNFGTNTISLGNTDPNGDLFADVEDATRFFRAVKHHSEQQKNGPGAGGTLNFQTANAAALVKDCSTDDPISGIRVDYKNGPSLIDIGDSDANGIASIELFPGGPFIFRSLTTGNTTTSISDEVSFMLTAAGSTVEFNPTNVTFIYDGTVQWNNWGSNYVSFSALYGAPYLYAGTHKFKFNGVIKTVEISGCSMTGGFLQLVDEIGDPLANYPADFATETRNLKWRYRCNGGNQPWEEFQTDANGEWFINIGCSDWTANEVQVSLNQTLLKQDVTVNSIYQAAKINVNLRTCDGLISETQGGKVSNFNAYSYTHGKTRTTGTVSFYSFPVNPGAMKIKMKYNHWFQILYPGVFPGVNEVDFMTTALTLVHDGMIRSDKGGSNWIFDQPTMNLLPGDYRFKFRIGNTWGPWITLTVGGCEMESILANITLKDVNGGGIAGGVGSYTKGGGNQFVIAGTTDANGNIWTLIPADGTLDKFKMVYKGQFRDDIWQNTEIDPVVEFNTILVTMRITDGVSDLVGTNAQYHGNAGGEWPFGTGTTTTSMELLNIPTGIKFYVSHDGGTLTNSFHKYSIDGPEVLFDLSGGAGGPAAPQGSLVENTDLGLGNNYPNPFDGSTTITFDLEEDSHVSLIIYDVNGKQVNVLVDQIKDSGSHKVMWDSRDGSGQLVPNGVYNYQIRSGSFVETKSMIRLR